MNRNRNKKLIVKKQDSDVESDSDSDLNNVSEAIKNDKYENRKRKIVDRFFTLDETGYVIPPEGSKQDNFTSEEILTRLEGFIPLKTIKQKEVLTTLPMFKTWVKYINTDTGKFRTGGLLMKVVYPDYIMLMNSYYNLTWSVQLKNTIIFIRNPIEEKRLQLEREREEAIKEELYQLYKKGELKRK